MSEAVLTAHKSYKLSSLWFVYFLYLLVIPAIAGVIINYVEIRKYKSIKSDPGAKEDPSLRFFHSHHQWLLRTFITTFVLALVAIGTSYYGAGFIIGGLAILWWIYRIGRGVINLTSHKPMPTDLES